LQHCNRPQNTKHVEVAKAQEASEAKHIPL
jgi:hypothetical protein